MCRYFFGGDGSGAGNSSLCTRGDECPYSHDRSTVPCRFQAVFGNCKNGDACPYSHDPLPPEKRQRMLEEHEQLRAGRAAGLARLAADEAVDALRVATASGDAIATATAALAAEVAAAEAERKRVEAAAVVAALDHGANDSHNSGDDLADIGDADGGADDMFSASLF